MFSRQLRHFTSFFIQLLEILSRKTMSLMKKNGLFACLPACPACFKKPAYCSDIPSPTLPDTPAFLPRPPCSHFRIGFLKMQSIDICLKLRNSPPSEAKAECGFPEQFRASHTGTQHSGKDYYFVGLTAANTTLQAHCILRLGKPTGNVTAHLQKLHPH